MTRYPLVSTISRQLQDGDCTKWLAKPDNPTMSPHIPKKTGTHHIDKHGDQGREKHCYCTHSTQNVPSSRHTNIKVSSTSQCNIVQVKITSKPLIGLSQTCMDVNSVKFHFTSLTIVIINGHRNNLPTNKRCGCLIYISLHDPFH